MCDYSMTQLSAKQSLLDIQIKRMKKLNYLLAEMIVLDMDVSIMKSIQDICKDIEKCANDIKNASENIDSYAFMAGQKLKGQESVFDTKNLKVMLDSIDEAGEAKQDG